QGAWLVGATLAVSLLLWLLGRRTRAELDGKKVPGVVKDLFRAVGPPLQFAAWYYCLYFAAPLAAHLSHDAAVEWLERNRVWLWHLGLVVAVFGFLYRAVRVVYDILVLRMSRTPSGFDDYLVRIGAFALRTLIPLCGVVVLFHLLAVPEAFLEAHVDPYLKAAFIVAAAVILHRAIVFGEQTVLGGLDLKAKDNHAARSIQTRVRILRKFAVVFNGLLCVSALLMLIPGIRTLGTSILASAGVAGIVLGFAAQKSLSTLFAGLQIALTQPIRLGDQLILLGDSGTVEEITLTYVVFKTWDGRRQIVPITYFIEQPFQNWSRLPTPLTCVLKLRVDFSLPLEPVRAAARKWVEESPHWNRQTYAFQVTDADGATMELRIIAGVPDSGASFNLQCELREKLIVFIRENYPHALPRNRQEAVYSDLDLPNDPGGADPQRKRGPAPSPEA
ncbi:MAG TPA: mechanosensitive ion channel domain-containing protein, partial [Candidatus Methylacidiphilales bacterium]